MFTEFESSSTSTLRVRNAQKPWQRPSATEPATSSENGSVPRTEPGPRNPSLGHLTRIADALEVPLASLFEGV